MFYPVFSAAHHELLHADWEGSRVEKDLSVLGQEANDILNEHHKILRQKLIRLGDTHTHTQHTVEICFIPH